MMVFSHLSQIGVQWFLLCTFVTSCFTFDVSLLGARLSSISSNDNKLFVDVELR